MVHDAPVQFEQAEKVAQAAAFIHTAGLHDTADCKAFASEQGALTPGLCV